MYSLVIFIGRIILIIYRESFQKINNQQISIFIIGN
jgi:hypothetical protein